VKAIFSDVNSMSFNFNNPAEKVIYDEIQKLKNTAREVRRGVLSKEAAIEELNLFKKADEARIERIGNTIPDEKQMGYFLYSHRIEIVNRQIEEINEIKTPAAGKTIDWREYGIQKQVLKADGKTIHESSTLKDAFLVLSAEYPKEFPAVPETLLNSFLRARTGKPYGDTYCKRVMTDIKQELKKQRDTGRKPLLNNKK
jgi:hypothetical protein